MTRLAVAVVLAIAFAPVASGSLVAQAQSIWLDKALTQWNQPGAMVTPPATTGDTREALSRRCGSSALKGSSAADALSKAGWVPFLHLDQQLVRDDVEVLGGMVDAGPGCEARLFNLFVFVQGSFAGTVSPTAMTRNRDGEVGAVRITAADAMTAEFARYLPGDPECCPSSRVRVTYQLDRRGARPILEAADVHRVR